MSTFWTLLFVIIIGLVVVGLYSIYTVVIESTLYSDGIRFKEKGQKNIARDKFNELLRRNENHVGAIWQLGLLYEDDFDRPKSIEKFEYILHRNLSNNLITEKDVRMHLADCYQKEGLTERALDEYNAIVERFPSDLKSLQKKGELLFEKVDMDAAFTVYRTMSELDPQNFGALLMCGKISAITHKYKEAVEYLRTANILKPDDRDCLQMLARAYEEENDFEAALSQYNKLKEIQEKLSPAVWIRMAVCYHELKQYDESIGILNQIISDENLSENLRKEVLYNLVITYFEMEDTSRAANHLEQLYELDHNYRDVADLMKKITGMLSDEEIVMKIADLHIYDFQEKVKDILEGMNLEIVHSEIIDDTSVNYITVDKEKRERKILIYARNWSGQIGQFPINELYLALNREKASKGIFLTPGNFKAEAIRFKELNRNIELIGQRVFCAKYRKTLLG